MKKVLLGTTALVAAGLLVSGVAYAQDEEMAEEEMMEEVAADEPVSVSVGGYYKAAIGFVSGGAAEGAQSPSIAQDIEINVGGSTTLDNALTVGVSANIEGNTGGGTLDERWIYFSGSFGDIQLGSIESASQQLTNFAPGAGGVFGVNSPFFLFTPGFESYIATYDDGLGAEDSAKLVYFSPSFNGFRIGASFAPGDTEQGQYGGNAAGTGMVDHTSLAAEYSADFGGASIRAMIGHETYEMDGMCDSSAQSMAATAAVAAVEAVEAASAVAATYVTDRYTLAQKRELIFDAFVADGESSLGDYSTAEQRAEDDYEATAHDMAVEKAQEVWEGTDKTNPLLATTVVEATDDAEEMVTITGFAGGDGDSPTLDDPTYLHTFRTVVDGMTVVDTAAVDAVEAVVGVTGVAAAAAKSAPNCAPTAMRYGLTVTSGDFSIGGGILTADMANDREKTSYDVGVSYSDGAYSFGLQMANSTEDMAGGGETERERIAINATYTLGPGISLSAQADEGEQTNADGSSSDWSQIMFGTSISF